MERKWSLGKRALYVVRYRGGKRKDTNKICLLQGLRPFQGIEDIWLGSSKSDVVHVCWISREITSDV